MPPGLDCGEVCPPGLDEEGNEGCPLWPGCWDDCVPGIAADGIPLEPEELWELGDGIEGELLGVLGLDEGDGMEGIDGELLELDDDDDDVDGGCGMDGNPLLLDADDWDCCEEDCVWVCDSQATSPRIKPQASTNRFRVADSVMIFAMMPTSLAPPTLLAPIALNGLWRWDTQSMFPDAPRLPVLILQFPLTRA